MTDTNKEEISFTPAPTIEIIDEESRSFWSQNASQVEQSVVIQEPYSLSSSRIPKLLPYTPPDTLMFPLFSAIQRKAWVRAQKLCHELVLCDPERKIYHRLYVRLEQITNLIDQQLHPQSVIRQAATASDDEKRSSQQLSQIENYL